MIEDDLFTSHIQLDVVPELKEPFFISAFLGWSNAGSVASDTIEYLYEILNPEVFGKFNNEHFSHFTSERPLGHVQDGLLKDLERATSQLKYWKNPSGNHDLVFLLSQEPHLNWELYSHVILQLVHRMKIRRLYTLGGVQDTISHSAPPQISIVGTSLELVQQTMEVEASIQAANYYGPISIHSRLIKMCMENDIEGVSLWGHVPAYLQRSPRAVATLVNIFSSVVGMECPVGGLLQKAIELDRKISEALARDPNLREFVEAIENKDEEDSPLNGEDKVIRLNEFLRKDPFKDQES